MSADHPDPGPTRRRADPVAEQEKVAQQPFRSQRRRRLDLALTKALRTESGVISLARLYQLGYAREEIRGLVRHGYLLRLHRGVYGDGRHRLHPRVHLKAALMALGPDAFLSGRSAAGLWGLRQINPRAIEATVVAAHTPRRSGLLLTRTAAPPPAVEVATRDGLRLSSVPRMLVELAAREPAAELDRLLTEAARAELLHPDELELTLGAHRGQPGIGLVRELCESYRPGPDRKSLFERIFDRWLAGHPAVPVPERNVGLGPWELDCLWPEAGLVLELDGRRWHTAVRELERDRRKDAWLLRRRIAVLRVTWNRWHHDHDGAVDDLLALIALGATGGTLRPSGGTLAPTGGTLAPGGPPLGSAREAA